MKKGSGPLNPHLGGRRRLQQGAGAAKMTSAPSVCTWVISHQSPDPPPLGDQFVSAQVLSGSPPGRGWAGATGLRTDGDAHLLSDVHLRSRLPLEVGSLQGSRTVPSERLCPAVAAQVGRQISGASCITIFQNLL